MNKLFTILGASTLTLGAIWSFAGAQAPQTIQGVPLKPTQKSVQQLTAPRAEQSSFSFDQITNWSGEGEHKAAFVVKWSDEREEKAMVYGYRWDGDDATGADMIQAIVENNPQLYALYETTDYGCCLGGLGFDRYNDGKVSVSFDEICYDDESGWFNIDEKGNYDDGYYSSFTADDPSDLWNSGFAYGTEGYWSYWTGIDFNDLEYSNVGLSSRNLSDGDIDAWFFRYGYANFDLGTLVAAPSVIPDNVDKQFTVDGLNYAVLNYDTKTVALMPDENFTYTDNIIIPETVTNGNDTYTVTEIGYNAFAGCAITSVTIPASVELISPMAFYGAEIADIIVLGKTPAKLCTDAFYEDMLPTNAITVPAGCGDAYKAAWSAAADIIVEAEADNTALADGTSEYLDFNKINVWVGEGSKQAALMLTFGDDKGMDNLVLGVRFDGNATAADILKAAADNFSRIELDEDGMAYDLNGNGSITETYDHSISAYNYFIDHTGEMADATAETAVANKDIVYISTADKAAYPDYKFYIPTDEKTGIWVLDEYTAHVSSTAQSFPLYINTGGSTVSSVTATFVDDAGKSDSTKASFSLTAANAIKGLCRGSLTTKAMGTVNIKIRAKIKTTYTDYVYCKLTIVDAVNKVEEITYSGDSDEITIEQYGVADIQASSFTALPSTADFKTVTCSVSDPDMIYVYSNRYYIARKTGECDIIATAGDGSGVTKRLHVTVKERERVVPDDQYQDGVFMLNEDWYSHAPGSINYFDADGKLYPQAYETNNPGFGFGNTAQFATIFGNRLFVSSKQSLIDAENQNGKNGGGRLVIADAATLKFITEFAEIGNDGRAVVGVNENKLYIGMSSNIRVLNIDTENDNYTLGNTITTGEIADFAVAANKVFALDSSKKNVIVINAETDEIIETLGENIVGLAQTADGKIWMAQQNKLFCCDPETLEFTKFKSTSDTDEEVEQDYTDVTDTPVCYRDSYHPDNFCASPNENVLFWRDGNTYSKSCNIYRWDLDNDAAPKILTTITVGSTQYIYSALNYDVKSDNLIIAVNPYTVDSNTVKFINAKTGEVKDVDMPDYFWFPSTSVSTDKYAAEFATDLITISSDEIGTTKTVDLREYVTDKDNCDYNITLALDGNNAISNNAHASISFEDGKLQITPLAIGSESVALKAVSNGRVTTQTITVSVAAKTDGVSSIDAANSSVSVANGTFTFNGYAGNTAFVFNANGQLLKSATIDTNNFSVNFGLPAGVYFVKLTNGAVKKAVIK